MSGADDTGNVERVPSLSMVREHIYKVFPDDMNANAAVFGGIIMATMDRIS